MQSVLLILQLIVAVALIITVLLQRSEGGALGIGGSGSGLGGMFSARGAANTLTQTTAFLAAAFFIISIVLNVLTLRGVQNSLDSRHQHHARGNAHHGHDQLAGQASRGSAAPIIAAPGAATANAGTTASGPRAKDAHGSALALSRGIKPRKNNR